MLRSLIAEARQALQEADRSLATIAAEIEDDWSKQGRGVNYAARPYLDAMYSLNKITDNYDLDTGSSVVAYFLSNATSWKGEKAKAIKKELNAMLKASYRR
jgi:hypothetical protein